jgi:hypothetical protein
VKRRRYVANHASDSGSSDRTGAANMVTESAAARPKSMGEVLATYFESRQNQKSQIAELFNFEKEKHATLLIQRSTESEVVKGKNTLKLQLELKALISLNK